QVVEEAPASELFDAPRHPYTRALLRTVPSLDGPRPEQLYTIEGQPPILTEAPAACSFRHRCAEAHDLCACANPTCCAVSSAGALAAPGHIVACHRVAASLPHGVPHG
ncbi:MAG: hypothetical protein K2X91_13015, partial [Thermoleophilia bacterium]|nr:hypothetical protein [Thermoleophilia bacterium]